MAKNTGKQLKLDSMAVEKARPRSTRYELADGEGLILRIMPTGGKSWHLRYVFDSDQKRISLGKYPGLSLKDARDKKDQALKDVANGIDPAEKADEEKRKRKEALTFADLLDEFWERELKKKITAADQKRLITKDVIPAWNKRKVASITRYEAVRLLDKVRDRAPVTGNRLQTVLVRMFNFAAERGIIELSPLGGKMSRSDETSRKRVLTDDEIKTLWNALDLEAGVDIYAGTKLALKMILLTGQRPGEVCGMTWDEIKSGVWISPATRRKTDEDQQVPLTAMMIDILKQARVFSGDSQYVFTSQRSPLYSHRKPSTAKPKENDLHVTRLSLSHAINRHWQGMGFDGERFTPHDLRRTVRTRLAELGIDDVVAERVLGHKLQGVLAIYNRYDYAAEKRQALERWESRLREILSITKQKTNVIPLEVHNV
ncbi:MAG: tyrosine-type recombinase/integrase [Syntrophorhabdaceae bacterium]|nr:tyrosine-type recombinase/integrase [Syntrophorhabdaceae bacterium]